jgi:spore germination protein PC
MLPNQYFMALMQEMHRALMWQTEKIARMDQELTAIKEQLALLHSSARTHVEKIEYNFEQLKVESLNGTLIIGISPKDTGTIEDWQVQNEHSEDVSLNNNANDEMFRQIRDEIYQYIRDTVPAETDKQGKAKNIMLSAEETQSVVEDMIRQADDRIAFYLRHMKGNFANDDAALRQNVCQKVKSDIHMAVDHYVEHFRKDGNHG